MTAPKVGAPGAGVEAGNQAQGEEQHSDCARDADGLQAVRRKRYETLRASLAMRGHAVYQLQCGACLVVWRGLTRELRTLDELEAHARRVGAPL